MRAGQKYGHHNKINIAFLLSFLGPKYLIYCAHLSYYLTQDSNTYLKWSNVWSMHTHFAAFGGEKMEMGVIKANEDYLQYKWFLTKQVKREPGILHLIF